MNLAVIACHVFNRELSLLNACSPNICRIFWLEQGLHDTPAVLNRQIQNKLDEIEQYQRRTISEKGPHRLFDAVVLAYGLCSGGVVGIKAGSLPLVIPRCDDCIALFLGSQQRYLNEFFTRAGIYWYTPGWVESGATPSLQFYEQKHRHYAALYGADNATYLIEAENGWIEKYKHCIYIQSPGLDNTRYEQHARDCARLFGWQFESLLGDNRLLARLLTGGWEEAEFLVCPPGHIVEATFDQSKIRAVLPQPQGQGNDSTIMGEDYQNGNTQPN